MWATGRAGSDLRWQAMQPNEENVTFHLQTRRAERSHTDRDATPDTRDRTIAELKSQVALLRRELARRDDVLMFLAGMVGPRAEGAPEMPKDPSSVPPPEGPRRPAPKGARDGARRRGARGEAQRPEWPPLPDGYRVVATASDAWVLVSGGVRVSGYREILDPEGVARDAWEHHRRNR